MQKSFFSSSVNFSDKTLIGIDANNVKFLNIFVWGLLGKGENIYNSLEDLERHLDEQ